MLLHVQEIVKLKTEIGRLKRRVDDDGSSSVVSAKPPKKKTMSSGPPVKPLVPRN